MNRKTGLTAAALAALALGACAHHGKGSASADAASSEAGKKGECHGVNACKGKGACGGADGGGHECAGSNACKGKGWLSLTEAECKGLNGKFKPG